MISPATILYFLEQFPRTGARDLRSLNDSLLRSSQKISETALIDAGFSDDMIRILVGSECGPFAEKIERWSSMGISMLSLFDAHYPLHLRTIPDPPIVLFIRGSIKALQHRSIGIVGARHADRQGIEFSQRFAEICTSHGLSVVSGLALGIDGAAHIGALRSGVVPTVAVLGNGVESCYPRSHQRMYEDILMQEGAILSEYEPGTPAFPSNFLERNRIIAGMSDALLVVQAAKRSGSLRTALAALEYGRDVAAIPWDISNKRGEGCNKLLQRGAYVVTGVEDVLSMFGIEARSGSEGASPDLSQKEKTLLASIERIDEVHLDTLRASFGAIDIEIATLELLGVIERSHSNMVRRVRA